MKKPAGTKPDLTTYKGISRYVWNLLYPPSVEPPEKISLNCEPQDLEKDPRVQQAMFDSGYSRSWLYPGETIEDLYKGSYMEEQDKKRNNKQDEIIKLLKEILDRMPPKETPNVALCFKPLGKKYCGRELGHPGDCSAATYKLGRLPGS